MLSEILKTIYAKAKTHRKRKAHRMLFAHLVFHTLHFKHKGESEMPNDLIVGGE